MCPSGPGNPQALSDVDVVWVLEAILGHDGLHCGVIEEGNATQRIASSHMVIGDPRWWALADLGSRGTSRGDWAAAADSERSTRDDARARKAIRRHELSHGSAVSGGNPGESVTPHDLVGAGSRAGRARRRDRSRGRRSVDSETLTNVDAIGVADIVRPNNGANRCAVLCGDSRQSLATRHDVVSHSALLRGCRLDCADSGQEDPSYQVQDEEDSRWEIPGLHRYTPW
jgi:hypothetical protein